MKIGIIGVGGRTGTMFAFELNRKSEIVGIGRKEEVEIIEKKNFFLERNKEKILFEGKIIKDIDFPAGELFDALFITTPNPIAEVVRYYYQKLKEKNLPIPALFLSQNGIEAGESAGMILEEIFGPQSKKIPLFRISLFNPIEKKIVGENHYIEYSLPIRLAIAQIEGEERKEFFDIFDKENFEVYIVSKEKAKDMEYSKLFLNLIGTASASHQLSLREGLVRKDIFLEEVKVLKEFVRVAKLSGIKFLNFPHYPVKFFSFLVSFLPPSLLFCLRKIFSRMIERGREGKKKNLQEIDYYNGAVVKLGKKFNVPTTVNEEILKRVQK